MNEKKFTISEAVSYGWQTTKKNFWFFLPITLVYLIINEWSSVVSFFTENKELLDFINIINLFLLPLAFITGIGFMVICLKKFDDKKTGFKDLFVHWDVFFKFILGGILYFILILILPALFIVPGIIISFLNASGVLNVIIGLITIVGVILIFYPGLMWATKYQFIFFLIVEKYSIKEAFKKSGELTQGIKANLFFLDLVLFMINIAGVLLIGLGLIITYPLTMMAMVYIYRKLQPTLSR